MTPAVARKMEREEESELMSTSVRQASSPINKKHRPINKNTTHHNRSPKEAMSKAHPMFGDVAARRAHQGEERKGLTVSGEEEVSMR